MSSLKELSILNEFQCDNLETRSSDKKIITRKHTSKRANNSNLNQIEETTIEVIIDDSSSQAESIESVNFINNNCQSFPNRNSASSYIETIKFPNELENSIHRRYIDYINLPQNIKDSSKTDYTYAHSFSYSIFVPLKNQFSWLVPNMSRQSLSSLTRQTAQDRQSSSGTVTASTSSKRTSYNHKQTSVSTLYEMAGSLDSPPIRKTRSKNSKPEYSDDDEDYDYTLSQPKINGIRPKHYVPEIEEDDDEEEEVTIIRRINRYITRTFRNYSSADKKNINHLSTSSQDNLPTSNTFKLVSYLSIFFLLVALLFGGYYSIPKESVDNIMKNIDKAYKGTASLFLWPFRPKIEYHNADQINYEIERLRNEVNLLRHKSEQEKANNPDKVLSTIDMPDFDNILLRLDEIERKVSTCCDKKPQQIDVVALEANLTSRLEDYVKTSFNSNFSTLHSSIDEHIIVEMKSLENKIIELVNKQMDLLKMDISPGARHQMNVPADMTFVQEMIRKAILKYDADKTGEADFALESAGAWIMSTRCSETYQLNSASYKIFGLTMWKSSSSPRVVIQTGVIPGECWCFRGNEGRLGIHLSAKIIPSAFTYEHIPKTLSRDGHIHSAPQSFSVYGLKTEDDLSPELLGEYIFDIETDEPLQRFKVQNYQIAQHGFNKVELVIKSNHGHPEYTCLYRFRVHGQVHNHTTNINP